MNEENKDRELLEKFLACQKIDPYKGWSVSDLNDVADEVRSHLGLPSVRLLNPEIDRSLTFLENSKDKLGKILDSLRGKLNASPIPQESVMTDADTKPTQITKEQLLEMEGYFTRFWGMDWFIQTSIGNFHWVDSSYGPPGTKDTITLFDGDYKDFCKHLNIDYGREKGFYVIGKKCGAAFTLI